MVIEPHQRQVRVQLFQHGVHGKQQNLAVGNGLNRDKRRLPRRITSYHRISAAAGKAVRDVAALRVKEKSTKNSIQEDRKQGLPLTGFYQNAPFWDQFCFRNFQ